MQAPISDITNLKRSSLTEGEILFYKDYFLLLIWNLVWNKFLLEHLLTSIFNWLVFQDLEINETMFEILRWPVSRGRERCSVSAQGRERVEPVHPADGLSGQVHRAHHNPVQCLSEIM